MGPVGKSWPSITKWHHDSSSLFLFRILTNKVRDTNILVFLPLPDLIECATGKGWNLNKVMKLLMGPVGKGWPWIIRGHHHSASFFLFRILMNWTWARNFDINFTNFKKKILVLLMGPLGKGSPWLIRWHHHLPAACQLCWCILSSMLSTMTFELFVKVLIQYL